MQSKLGLHNLDILSHSLILTRNLSGESGLMMHISFIVSFVDEEIK